ncbi:MAG: glycosyltransferase [Maribacter sp.]
MNIIIFDSEITGHHSEYINHLIEYLVVSSSDDSYYFVVHPDFPSKFKNIVSKTENCSHIHWRPITRSEEDSLASLSIMKKSFVEYNLVEKYVTSLNADIVYLMHFNTFQLALAFKRSKFRIRGILFNQFFRTSSKTLKEKILYYRKYLITKFYCLNTSVESIFVLNDEITVERFNTKFKTDIFKVLPDPVLDLPTSPGFDIYKRYNIEKNQNIFLHFGSLAMRKGTFEIINAAQFIPQDIQSKTTILLVGKPENQETHEKISTLIHHSKKTSKVNLIWEDCFVSNGIMKGLFAQCTAVVMPYKNPEASSGILGHAIVAKKPVISIGKGLLKELVESNNFGILLDKVTPNSVAIAMVEIGPFSATEAARSQYIEEHTIEKFSQILLG